MSIQNNKMKSENIAVIESFKYGAVTLSFYSPACLLKFI